MERIEVNVITGEQRTVPLTAAEIEEIQNRPVPVLTTDEQRAARAAAYTSEADPLFFKAQRGEATIEEWQSTVADIRARFPYPTEVES
ncbi:MAG: hypothetical protein FJ077_12850 [Cyanobacteria bacterium K_DeepCast_35m_m2_023]|nr:hypothetical protein [Cyanobacteria bacterium K_DeepCast_35m_m2_023]